MIIDMNRVKTLLAVCGIGMMLFTVAGCSKKDPAELVRQRAIERWDLLGGKHAVKAYDFLSPGYRSTHTLEQYVAFVATARVQWKSSKVNSVQCNDEVCTVNLSVVSSIPGAILQRPTDMEFSAPVVEKWVRSDGEWYFLPESKIEAKSIVEQVEAKKDPQESTAPAAAPASPSAPVEAGKDSHK